jgi:hypothetical protein
MPDICYCSYKVVAGSCVGIPPTTFARQISYSLISWSHLCKDLGIPVDFCSTKITLARIYGQYLVPVLIPGTSVFFNCLHFTNIFLDCAVKRRTLLILPLQPLTHLGFSCPYPSKLLAVISISASIPALVRVRP